MAANFYEKNTSGLNADRFMSKFDESTLVNVQRHYWTARQFIRSKLGKKEDEHLEASDLELDTCLNLYRSVQSTSTQLLTCIDAYVTFQYDEALVENVLGKYMKEKGKQEKAENIKRSLIAVGRCLMFASHQMNAARVPLSTFLGKLAVFVERAIGDCSQTVEAVEMARTEYRGSLLWMKKTSEELDPEVEGSMEKFRDAQATVRVNKDRLDKLKTDTLQKVDLLSASRSNLLSHVLTHYQHALYNHYARTARAYETLAENISSLNDYEFEVLSHLFTGVKQPSASKASKKEPESVEQPMEPQEAEIADLLFGRESPLFTLDEEVPERESDSPLCEPVDPQTHQPSPKEVPAKYNFAVGPLAPLYNSELPVPALNPPPSSSQPSLISLHSSDLLSMFGNREGTKKTPSPQRAQPTDWSSLLEGFELQKIDNSFL
ncbi:unnamed protein product [Caenorhabditis auriculariae]|uniref:AH domain-containing protein n=1 Tax=Caenorhabditis auriculariae TaxID=2777116 RepID=A0A8S1HHU5_9PELO|nr:unnamed protein product [Caenorhabditis auriculariae]